MKKMIALLAGLLLSSAVQAKGEAGAFDYYAMALSWSPEHCAVKPADRDQCSRKLGFVLHGLWPQYDCGYPSNCTRERLEPDMESEFADLYPSRFLYRHEWEKHGTCSGLSQQAFHQLASDLRQKVKIPAAYRSRKSRCAKAASSSRQIWRAPTRGWRPTISRWPAPMAAASCGRSTSASIKRGRMPSPVPPRCKSASAAPAVSRISCCAACVKPPLSSSGPLRA